MQLSIVSYLDETATNEVKRLQEAVSEITGSKAALQAWQPHITVGDGVEVNTENEFQRLAEGIEVFAKSNPSFAIVSHEFGARDSRPIGIGEVSTPYVLELKVSPSEVLDDMVAKLSQITDKYQKWYRMPEPYRPHIAIAFRDLDENGYRLGIAYLEQQSVGLNSLIDHIALVEKLPEQDIERVRFALRA